MSAYRVLSGEDGLIVEFDGERIELVAAESHADPLFSLDAHSDGRINLAYGILLHHRISEGEAELLSRKLVSQFPVRGDNAPFDIACEDLDRLISMWRVNGYETQDGIRSMKKADL